MGDGLACRSSLRHGPTARNSEGLPRRWRRWRVFSLYADCWQTQAPVRVLRTRAYATPELPEHSPLAALKVEEVATHEPASHHANGCAMISKRRTDAVALRTYQSRDIAA